MSDTILDGMEEIRKRHDAAEFAKADAEQFFRCRVWRDNIAFEAHKDRATLLAAITASEAERERMRNALTKIACFGDMLANDQLGRSGSYGLFDEPYSVEIARRALDSTP